MDLGIKMKNPDIIIDASREDSLITVLKKIDANTYFDENYVDRELPMKTVIMKTDMDKKLLMPEVQQIFEKERRDTSIEDTFANGGQIDDAVNIKSFEEVYKELNQHISNDELIAFVWYYSQIGRPLSGQWVNLFDKTEIRNTYDPVQYEPNQTVKDRLVNNGIVFYFKELLVPSFIYLSGDIYTTFSTFENEKDKIKTKFGQNVMDRQGKAITDKFLNVRSDEVKITGETKNGMYLDLRSEFCANFKVGSLTSMEQDKKYKFAVSIHDGKERINISKTLLLKDKIRYDSSIEIDNIELPYSFAYWLINSSPSLKNQNLTISEIISYYFNNENVKIRKDTVFNTDKKIKYAKIKKREDVNDEVNRLLLLFLNTELSDEDKRKLELAWNRKYNNNVEIDTEKCPVAFTMCKNFRGMPEKVRKEKRESVARLLINGNDALIFEVGVGKTSASLFCVSALIDAGWVKRPLFVVPNQVYNQFISEAKDFVPSFRINELYNLNKDIIEKENKINDRELTFVTYEGFRRLTFEGETLENVVGLSVPALSQWTETASENENDRSTLEKRVRKELTDDKNKGYDFEKASFDFICYDEAHKMKKIFAYPVIHKDDKPIIVRSKPPTIGANQMSSIAMRGFIFNLYIWNKNNNRNILLLTATPFTNKPHEIYSMLSLVNYKKLIKNGYRGMGNFFLNFLKIEYKFSVTADLNVAFRPEVSGFFNKKALQSIIYSSMIKKTADDIGLRRPDKIVIPLHKKIENGITIKLPKDEIIPSYLEMTSVQAEIMDMIQSYMSTGEPIKYVTIKNKSISVIDVPEVDNEKDNVDTPDDEEDNDDEIKDVKDTDDEMMVDDQSFTGDNDKKLFRIRKGINYSASLALSPYLLKFVSGENNGYKDFVESSSKLMYVMKCISSVKNYNLAHGEPIAGQIIFSNRGVKKFHLIKEYIVKELGFEYNEVEIIKSGMPVSGKGGKENIKNLFNGEEFNKNTGKYEPIEDKRRIKVLIGSSTIQEGMNLQKRCPILYNCFIDFNPTNIKQLEGRIHRQGNPYNTVRIVNPLTVGSSDIFTFQKLQEKTYRINSIWSKDKSNEFKIETFDPEEIKYDLINDINLLVGIRISDERKELLSLKFDIQTSIQKYRTTIKEYEKFFGMLAEIKKFCIDNGIKMPESENNILDFAKGIIRKILNTIKTQLDDEGRKRFNDYLDVRPRDTESTTYSPFKMVRNPKDFQQFRTATTILSRDQKTYLRDINLNINDVDFHDRLQVILQNESIRENKVISDITDIDTPSHREKTAEDIKTEKREKGIISYSIEECVASMSTLNSTMNDHLPFTEHEEKEKDEKINISQQIKSLTLASEFLTGKNKRNAQKIIDALKLTMEIL